jgi:hypothetical protein
MAGGFIVKSATGSVGTHSGESSPMSSISRARTPSGPKTLFELLPPTAACEIEVFIIGAVPGLVGIGGGVISGLK